MKNTESAIAERFEKGFKEIQVLLGPRQVGKTTSIQSFLKKYKEPSMYVSADEALETDLDWLDRTWQKAYDVSPNCLLVIDEIQKVHDWSSQIKKLWDKQKISKKSYLKLFLLGSSSLKIQKGLSESLTGRFELIRAYHWNFLETQKIKKMSFENYMLYGGYPGAYDYMKDADRFSNYLTKSIVQTVIEKDILQYNRIKNPSLFKQLFEILSRLPSCEISYTKLLGQLQDKGNTDLIKDYLDLYEGAFLFQQVHKYQTSHFARKTSSPKIIPMTPAMIQIDYKTASKENMGLAFEALVGSDLLRAELKTYYWRSKDNEVDFVIEYKNRVFAIEVKSGKKKSSKSLTVFKNNFPESIVIFVNPENYEKFCADPKKFIERFI